MIHNLHHHNLKLTDSYNLSFMNLKRISVRFDYVYAYAGVLSWITHYWLNMISRMTPSTQMSSKDKMIMREY